MKLHTNANTTNFLRWSLTSKVIEGYSYFLKLSMHNNIVKTKKFHNMKCDLEYHWICFLFNIWSIQNFFRMINFKTLTYIHMDNFCPFFLHEKDYITSTNKIVVMSLIGKMLNYCTYFIFIVCYCYNIIFLRNRHPKN